MNAQEIMKSDVLDILFQNKNKMYGAYQLRKNYQKRLFLSIGLMTVLTAIAAFFISQSKSSIKKTLLTYETTLVNLPVIKEPEVKKEDPIVPQTKKIEPKVSKKVEQSASTSIESFTANVVISKEILRTLLPKKLDSVAIGSVAKTGSGGEGIVGITHSDPGPVVNGTGGPNVELKVDQNTPMVAVDVMPQFPGGTKALQRFLEKNLVNPVAMEEGEKVTVKMQFIVGYDGQLKGFKTLQDGGKEFNDEVVRVLRKMPNWIPGKSNGTNVSVYYSIPVSFVPADY